MVLLKFGTLKHNLMQMGVYHNSSQTPQTDNEINFTKQSKYITT